MQKLSIERLIKGKFSCRPKTKVNTPRMVKSPVHKFLYNYKASNENPCGQLFFWGVQSTPVSDGNKQPKSTMDCKKIQLSSVNKLIIFHCYDAITVTTYTFHQKPATSQGNKKKRDSFLKCNLKVGCSVFLCSSLLMLDHKIFVLQLFFFCGTPNFMVLLLWVYMALMCLVVQDWLHTSILWCYHKLMKCVSYFTEIGKSQRRNAKKQAAENGNCCIFHIKKSGSTNMIYLLLVWGCKTTWMLGRRHQKKTKNPPTLCFFFFKRTLTGKYSGTKLKDTK